MSREAKSDFRAHITLQPRTSSTMLRQTMRTYRVTAGSHGLAGRLPTRPRILPIAWNRATGSFGRLPAPIALFSAVLNGVAQNPHSFDLYLKDIARLHEHRRLTQPDARVNAPYRPA
jgi:hypothetical protein